MTIAELKNVAAGRNVKSIQTGMIFTVNAINEHGFDLISTESQKHLVTRVNCDAANRPSGWQTPEPTSHMVRWSEPLAAKVAATVELV